MTEQERPSALSERDWSATPAAVQALVQEQAQRIALLEERLAALEERVKQTSRTSSRPPSSDPPSAPPRRPRRASGRSVGGQVGYEGHGRPLLPVEQVDHIVEVKPPLCGQCGTPLEGDDPSPARHQVAELPRVAPEV